jgi:hypothetical protein
LHCEPTTHIVIEAGDTTFVPIDPPLARRFNITENIWAHQFATKNGIHIIFTKNRVGRKLPSNQPTIEGGYPT